MKTSREIGSLRRGKISLLFALTLAVTCEAFNQLSVSFLVWSRTSMDAALTEAIVSVALRSFLCHEAKLILLDTYLRSACDEQRIVGEEFIFTFDTTLAMIDFIKQTDPIRSYISAKESNLLISDVYVIDDIQGSTWDVTYNVLQVGSNDVEKARVANVTDEIAFLEYRTQQALNLSIVQGMMDERLRGTEITMGKIGEEFETLPENTLPFGDENIHADPGLNYKQSALVLRYIGIIMLMGSFSSIFTLTCMRRYYALDEERKEMAAIDPEYQRGLVTEQGVNLILERGRRGSERISSNATP